MAEDNIEMGDNPYGEGATGSAQQTSAKADTIEEPIGDPGSNGAQAEPGSAYESTSESADAGNAHQGTSEGKSSKFEVDAETGEKIFELMPMAIKQAKFDFDNLKGEERDAGRRSVATAKNVFAHAYAIDPDRAVKAWTDANHNIPPSQAMIQAAQLQQLEKPRSALENLTANVEKSGAQIAKINTEQQTNELRKRQAALAGPQGDAEARSSEHLSSLIDNAMPKRHDQNDNGTFLWKAVVEGMKNYKKIMQYISMQKRSREMSKEIKAIDKQLRVIDAGKVSVEKGQTSVVKQTMKDAAINVATMIPGVGKAAKAAMATRKAAGPVADAVSVAAQRAAQSQDQGRTI